MSLEFQGTNVKDILDEFAYRYGMEAKEILYDREGTFNPDIQIVLNGKDWIPACQYDRTPLHDGDTVSLTILLSGG